MLGFDTVWHNDLGDGPLARLAVIEHRILLTRDRQLLMRQELSHGCYLCSRSSRRQLDELVHRLDLCAEGAPFTRCMACNETLLAVDPAAVQSEVTPAVYRRHQEYWRCQGCGRLYWKGTHWEAMRREIEGICPAAPMQARRHPRPLTPTQIPPGFAPEDGETSVQAGHLPLDAD
jgi:uncharacterized protein with PIN domain